MKITNYISDNISEEIIKNWEGNNVLLVADTGLGKTTFIRTKFAQYFQYKSIIYLCNRISLREQVVNEMQTVSNITVQNYQYYENNLDVLNELQEYDIIVCDEAHYFGTDSFFNPKNIIIYEKIINSKCTKIFMTATPECLYFNDDFIQFSYTYKKDINKYIESCYFYYDTNAIIEKLKHIPQNEKCLYICNDIKENIEIKKKLESNADILVSKGKDNVYKQYNCQKTFDEIINHSMFTSKILISTTCIDNGISLKMLDLKHIVIDMINPIILKQILGRKRFLCDEDKVNIYIRNHNIKELAGILNKDKSIYEQANFFMENHYIEFFKKYNFTSYDSKLIYPDIYNGNDINFKLNTCYYNYFIYQKEYIQDMKINNYLQYICNYIGININRFISLECEHDFAIIKDFAIRYNEKKLYIGSDEYNELIDIFKNRLLFYRERTQGIGNVTRYINILTSRRSDCEINIQSIRETKGIYADKMYWILTYKEYDNNFYNDIGNISA